MVTRYGTSCFLQLLDDETAPSEDKIQKAREERISKAKAMQSRFQQELCDLISVANHDHSYSSSAIAASHYTVEDSKVPPSPDVVRNLYEEHICIGPSEAIYIEASTLWHDERKLRISASIMKTICHRKQETGMKPFVTNKLAQKSINSPAINYGLKNESIAIDSYINCQKKKGIDVAIHKCGLFINVAIPWLPATPDSLVSIGEDMGCLEVKCPFVCVKSIMEASMEKSCCLQTNSDGVLQLKRSHLYFLPGADPIVCDPTALV